MIKHLGVFDKLTAEAILSGKKTIETRFSKNKIAPFAQVFTDDLVYIKLPGDDIIGQFKVKKVVFFEGLTPEDIEGIFKTWGSSIGSGDPQIDKSYQDLKRDSRFGTLIFIKESERFLTPPINFNKKDRRGWVVIG